MFNKKWFLAITLILLFSIATPVFATITVSDLNLTCSPLNKANDSCFKDSRITVVFKVTDSNVVSASADGNTFNWVLTVYRGMNGEYGKGVGGIAVLTDANLQSYCSSDRLGNDKNFNLGRNCSTIFGPISSLVNGTNGIDLNVSTYTGATWIRSNADDNASVEFNINNALMRSSDQNLLAVVPIALVAAAIVMIVGSLLIIKSGSANIAPMLAGLVGLVVALVVIAIFLALIAGTTGV